MKTPYDQIAENIAAGNYRNNVGYPTKDDPDRHAKIEAYRQADRRCMDVFREDLEVAFETFRLRPEKRKLLWDKAWEHGHANGWNEVLYWYNDFLELVKW